MNIFKIFLIFALGVILSSCATVPIKPPPQGLPPMETIIRGDIYHQVGPGETIWRIGKTYDVSVEDIVRANKLGDLTQLKAGEKLLVPNAASPRPVISLYASDKWEYIIIHHSATDEGNALFFDELHSRKGWAGVGYHFVIDNGSCGRADGQIETSPRWIKQSDGAHCKASGMNHRGIGICLVGDFSRGYVTQKQFDSLVNLVNTLKDYYHISRTRITGHGHVPEAATECPGRYFPWDEFWKKVK